MVPPTKRAISSHRLSTQIVGNWQGRLGVWEEAWHPAASKAGREDEFQRSAGGFRRDCLDDLRTHDLRHSFTSFAAEAGASLQLIGKALGHTQMRTTERYAHLRDGPLHALVSEIGERVKGAKKVPTVK